MAFVGIKQIGQKRMKFNADGSVELLKPLDLSSSVPQKSAPQQVADQIVEKAQKVVEAVEDAVKPKARRGRPKKASAE